MARQLVLALPHRPALGREDFLVAASNETAVAMIDAWPDWSAPWLVLSGPAGSGKTHLAEVWRMRSSARHVDPVELPDADIAALAAAGPLVLEGIDALSEKGERALFHLVNLTREEGGFLLMTSRTAPAQQPFTLPDLASRLRAAPHAELGSPDDELLAGVLAKLFDDRQLSVPDTLIPFLLPRMERSVAAARALVAMLDEASLAGKRPLGPRLAAEILERGPSQD